MILTVDLRVELEVDESELSEYESALHFARESYRDIADSVRVDDFTILYVGELKGEEDNASVQSDVYYQSKPGKVS
jgi:hypothetical protein